ncbi:hypothetical protein NQ318_006317 [Aromia moschata]|uniref:Uncharacterized protein n=1 Tax=Aromia moschata TaxID=1265417 RepID=A0AAV8XC29_9CUCU|nr:hypothetical protein NQ318_006317 [Aromia moschata]
MFSQEIKWAMKLANQETDRDNIKKKKKTGHFSDSRLDLLFLNPEKNYVADYLELHPYHLQFAQEILRANEPLRLKFCQWFIIHFNNNDDVFEKVFLLLRLGSILRGRAIQNIMGKYIVQDCGKNQTNKENMSGVTFHRLLKNETRQST